MNKALGMIGLAKRAGKVVSGEFLCDKAIKSGDAKLIIIACDISERSKRDIVNACSYYNVNYIVFASSGELGKYSGTGKRTVISVNDENFANAVLSKIERVEN